MEPIGNNLKRIRTSRGITQDDVAAMLQVKRQTYGAYERNITVPDAISLKKIADFLGVSMHDIVTDESDIKYAAQDGGYLTEKQQKEVNMFVEFIRARDSIDNE